MSRRKVTVAKNTKESDETMLQRMRDFCNHPHTDDKLDFTLHDKLTIGADDDILCTLVKATMTLVGLFLIAFIRCLRPRVYDNNGNEKYQDIIIRTIDESTRSNIQYALYSYGSFKSMVSILLNSLRRFASEMVQSEIQKCHEEQLEIPDWVRSPKTFNIYGNLEYGYVEKVYRDICDYLFVHKNKTGYKVQKYIPSTDFMMGFRRLSNMYLKQGASPYDVQLYVLIRISGIYVGRSGEEMKQWHTSHVLIRDKWTKLMIPKGWKNTKSSHQIKASIKISSTDPICGALKMMINCRPKGSPLNLFLRPLENWKVSYFLTLLPF